uniref:Uncharacterized protein n=1 Tax=Arundo donax TaxID=35708 RepID=A0A0A9CLN4_ARUDO
MWQQFKDTTKQYYIENSRLQEIIFFLQNTCLVILLMYVHNTYFRMKLQLRILL